MNEPVLENPIQTKQKSDFAQAIDLLETNSKNNLVQREFQKISEPSLKAMLGSKTKETLNGAKLIVDKTSEISKDKNPDKNIFYKAVFKAGEIVDVVIVNVKYIELLYSWGYRRYDIGEEFVFIKITDNVIKKVTNQQILDELIDHINSLPEEIEDEGNNKIKKHLLKEKIFKSPQNYNSDQKLAQLKNKEELILNLDTKNECFIYFKNGFVLCTKDSWDLKPYSDLTNYIWENQIIKRDFVKEHIEGNNIKSLSVFARFMYNASGNKIAPDLHQRRFESLCSIAGYMLSSFMDIKLKAMIFTDSTIDEAANGRTGKTLFGEMFSHLKSFTEIPGKEFDPRDKNKYDLVEADTQVVFINDAKKNLPFELLYNDITEGMKVRKLYKTPFVLKTKVCISTNKTIKIEGGSSEDRCIEFEFSDYYKPGFGPDNEFGHRFFTEWDDYQWTQFYNFMMFCLSLYIGCGIIKPENINLNRRKLLDGTNPDFVYFMDKKTGIISEDTNTKLIPSGEEFSKHEFYSEFLIENPEYSEPQNKMNLTKFTKWVQAYVKFDKRFGEYADRRSGSNSWYKLSYIQK